MDEPRKRGSNTAASETSLKKIDRLEEKFDSFLTQYDTDMRGDGSVKDGADIGLINEIRTIKEYIKKYPSIPYLFATHPVKVTAWVVGVFSVLMFLYTVGLLDKVATMVGL